MKRHFRFPVSAFLILFCMGLAHSQQAPKPADPYENWGRMREFKVRGNVTVVLKDNRRCYHGSDITGVTDHDVIIKFPQADGEYVLEDKEVLLIATGLHFSDIGVSEYLISARSSWADVKNFANSKDRKVRVTLKDGKKLDGELAAVADDSLSVKPKKGDSVAIAKTAIQKVEVVRQKPMPKALGAMADEATWMVPFNPQSMPYLLHWNDTIRVRVYEASLPEDNEPLNCGDK